MSRKESILYYCRRQFSLLGDLKQLNQDEQLEALLFEIKQKLLSYDRGDVRDIPLALLQIADWIIGYIGDREVNYDVVYEALLNLINQHFMEYCLNNAINRKAFEKLTEKVDCANLLSRSIQGEIFINQEEGELAYLARLPLVKKKIENTIDALCEEAKKKKEAELKRAETQKYLNKQGGRLSDRVEPIITKVIDLLIDKLDSPEELDLAELNKLLNTVLTPVAKMRGEIQEGKLEVNAHTLFVNMINFAENADVKKLQKQILEVEAESIKHLT